MNLLTASGPGRATTTVGVLSLFTGFARLDLGHAAAGGGVVLRVPVLVLGLVAGLLVVLSRAAVQPVRKPSPPHATTLPLVLGAIALVVAIVVWWRGLWPVAAGWSGRAVPGIRPGAALARLLLHDLPTTVSVVAVALAAAFGIAMFRPLGRASEWLLLPFAPWLFVTSVVVAPALFLAYTRGTVQRPFAHLQPALGLLPMLLFAFVLLLRGMVPGWRTEGPPRAAPVRQARARARLARRARRVRRRFAAVTRDFVTPYLTVVNTATQPLPLAVSRAVAQYTVGRDVAVTRPDLPLAVVTFAVIAVAVAWYSGRLVLRTGPGAQSEWSSGP